MKLRFLLFIFICLTAYTSYSHPYKSIFGKSSTEWSIVTFCGVDATQSGSYIYTHDTIILGLTYKIVSHHANHEKELIREDTLNGKVWTFDWVKQKENLIMDLSLQLNDTFYFASFTKDSIPAIVDSVYFKDSVKIIQLSAKNQCYANKTKLLFIEGVGTNSGIRNYFQVNDQGNNQVGFYGGWLLCQTKDGISTYKDLRSDSCYLDETGISESLNQTVFKLFPNPATEFLTVELSDFKKNSHLKISNTLGQEIIIVPINSSKFSTDLSGIKPGIYFISINGNTQKFIKN